MAEAKRDTTKDDGILKKMRERFGAAANYESENRQDFENDVEMSTSDDQWPNDIKNMRGDGRPRLTINRLNGTVKQIEGDYRQNKIALKILPQSGDASEETADIIGGIIRNIEQQSKADQVYLNALRYAARGNIGWMRVMPEYASDDTFEQDLFIRPIFNPLTVYCDPKARLVTREDARFIFVSEMVDKDEFKQEYPDAQTVFAESLENYDDSFEDWVDGDTVRVVEYFTKESLPAKFVSFSNGAVLEIESDLELQMLSQIGWKPVNQKMGKRTIIKWRKCTAAEVLEEREYKMRYIPVIPCLGEEINLKGKVRLRSAIYYGKDPQRMYNYWKTAATESVALQPKSPYLLTAEQIENYEEQWKGVNNKPQPFLNYNHKADQPPPQRLEPPMQPIGEMAMAGGANIDIQYTTNTFDANLGQKSNEQSGIALQERQHQGTIGNLLFIDNLKTAIEHCGRVLIDFIPLIYDTERVVRTIGLEGDSATVTINKAIKNPILGITEVLNDITVGKYQVVVEAGQAFATRRREAVDGMLKFAQSFPNQAPLIADLIVENMDVPGGEVMADRLKRSLPPQITLDPDSPEGQAQLQQAQQKQDQKEQLQAAMAMSHIKTQEGKNQADMAKAGAQVAKANAETVRAKADTIIAAEEVKDKKAERLASVLDNSRMGTEAAQPMQATPQAQQQSQIPSNIEPMLTALAGHLSQSHKIHEEHANKIHHAIGQLAHNQNQMGQMLSKHEQMLNEMKNGSKNNTDALMAHTLATLAKVNAAPTIAITDKAGRITGARKDLS